MTATQPLTTTTAIAARRLFDGEAVHDDMVVRVQDGRIASVSPRGVDASEPGEERVDAAFVMPGLIDAHGHASGYREGAPMGAPFVPATHFMRLMALNGVTTLRDTGNSLETMLYLRLWSEKHGLTRLFSSGPILDAPPLTWAFSRVVRDGAEARTEIERLAVQGIDFIKAYARITPEVLPAIVAAASDHGLPVAIDCHATSARQAAAAGVRSIEHAANLLHEDMLVPGTPRPEHGSAAEAIRWSGVDLDGQGVAALTELLLDRGTFVTPTLLVHRRWALWEEMVGDPDLEWMVPVMPYHRHLLRMRGAVGMRLGRRHMAKYMPVATLGKDERRAVEKGLERQGGLVRELLAAGVRVVAGTDTPNPSLVPGFSLHAELEQLVGHGVEPLAALRAATSRPAELLERDDLGVIRPGAEADLVLTAADPTHDIAATRRIERVMCRGRWVDRDGLRARLREAITEEQD
jgi:imidazolonepropionase-like amidohydrolase